MAEPGSWACVPEEYGGAGADTVSYALAVMEIARADASTAITMAAHVSLAPPFYLFGTGASRDLVPLAREDAWGFGLTRPNAGSDAGNVKRRPVKDGKFTINGTKAFITSTGTDLRRHDDHRGDRHASGRQVRDFEPDRSQATPVYAQQNTRRWVGARGHTRACVCRRGGAGRDCSGLEEGYRQFLTILDGGASRWRRSRLVSRWERTTKRLYAKEPGFGA